MALMTEIAETFSRLKHEINSSQTFNKTLNSCASHCAFIKINSRVEIKDNKGNEKNAIKCEL